MIYPVIGFFLFVVPFIVNRTWADGVRAPKEFLSILGFVSIISVIISNYRLKPFKHKFLLFFWLWCIFTTVLSDYKVPFLFPGAAIEISSNMLAWKEFFYISIVIFTVYCLSSFIPNGPKQLTLGNFTINYSDLSFEQSFRIIAKITAYAVVLMSIYAVIQIIGFDEWFRAYDPSTGWLAAHPLSKNPQQTGALCRRVVGTVGNPSILAIWMALCLPLCLYLRSKLGYIASFLSLIIIGVTISATAIVGAILGIFIYLFFNFKKTFLCVLIILIPIAFAFSSNVWDKAEHLFDPTGRIEIHKETFKILENKATTGFGLGTFEYLVGGNLSTISKLKNQNWKELHDEYGQLWWSVGLVGLMLFLGFIFTSIRHFFKNINPESMALFASLSVFMVMSLSYFTMRIAPISFYGVILLGLFLQQGEK